MGSASVVVVSCGEVNTGFLATHGDDDMRKSRDLCDMGQGCMSMLVRANMASQLGSSKTDELYSIWYLCKNTERH